jgi:hypothetical protein
MLHDDLSSSSGDFVSKFTSQVELLSRERAGRCRKNLRIDVLNSEFRHSCGVSFVYVIQLHQRFLRDQCVVSGKLYWSRVCA